MGIFSSSRAAPAKIGCFGKLPSYGDFLSLNAEGPEAQALAAWLQSGVSVLSTAAVAADQTVTFVWRPEDARRTLVGALWPSADSAGRRFPFALFAAYSDDHMAPHGARRLLAAEPTWRRLLDVHARTPSLARVSDQYSLIDAAAPALPDAREVQQAFTQRAHAAMLRRQQEAAPLGVQLQQIAQYAGALRGPAGIPDFALRMRLTDSADPDVEATAWLQVLLRRLEIDDLPASMFLRFPRAAAPSLYVFHRPVDAADLGFLLAPADGYRRADSIGFQVVAAAAPDPRGLDSFQRSWAASTPSIASLLGLAGCPVAPADAAAAPVAVFSPAAAPVSVAAASGDANEITGEMHAYAAPAAEPTTGDAASETTDGVVDSGITDDAPITDETPAVTGAAVIEARIRELAAGPMLPGRLARASTSAAASSKTGESAAGDTVLLYLEDGGHSVILSSLPDAAVQRIEQHLADRAEALRLIEELRRLHDATEQRLLSAVEDACARTPRPGGAR